MSKFSKWMAALSGWATRACLAWLGATAWGVPRPAEYALRDWHPQDGLPSEDTTRVLQGSDGFLWIATTNTVARFDGSQFERVSTHGADNRQPTLARALVETAELGVVVAPTTGGLLAARGGGAFQAVSLPTATNGRVFNVLFAAADGALWGADGDGRLSRLTAAASAAESFPTTDELNGRPVIFFANDAQQRTWVSNGTNLYRYAEGKLRGVETGRERVELRIGSSRRDGPWLVANERLLQSEGGVWVEKGTLPPLVSAHYIQTLLEDRDGALWIGTRSQGVFVFARGVLTHVPGTHDDILGLGEDAEGDVWVATNGGGLNRLRRKIFRLFDKDVGLIDNFSNTVCEDRDGTMWFGNRDGGVARLRSGGKMEIVPPPAAWPIISAVSVAPHPAGGIWVTAGPGIFRIADSEAPSMEQVAHPALPIIRCTLVAKSGALWFSAEPDRLGRLMDGTVTFFGREAGLGGKQVRAIAEDGSGRIWVGMADGTLCRQNGERFERVALDRPAGVINAIHHDEDGTVWLGTGERGLVVGAEGRWRSVDATRGLPDNNVTQILADERGSIWCGSARGIFRVSRAELLGSMEGKIARVHAVLIGRDEGLKDISCLGFFQPAAWKSRDGKLWFATRRGVLEFDPELAISEATVPPVRVEEVTCDDGKLAERTGFGLDAGFRKLELRFSVLCLATPERVRVRYRLDGFDGDWQSAAANHVAVYPRLPAGDYRFRVKASVADGEGEESLDEVLFSVVPPWWQTRWFLAGGAALAVVAVWLAVRAWTHRRLRTRLENLERQSAVERERTRIAQNIHDDLGASLTRISLLTQAAPPDTPGAAQLEKIYATAAEATRAMDEIVWAVNPKYDDLDGLAGYLGNFAQSFLGTAGVRCRLDMPGHWPAAALTSQMRHNLFLSCKEALHNVVKHAGASEVTLGVAVQEGRLVVTIADNGCGRTGASGSRAPYRSASGQGTENMRRRLAEMGGRCEIADAADGAGTTVTFLIPLAESV